MTNSILLVAGGLVLLAIGGELLVRGAVGRPQGSAFRPCWQA